MSRATGGTAGIVEYQRGRNALLSLPRLKDKLPRFVQTCRDPDQFWSYIQPKFSTYDKRRKYIWEQFRPLIEMLENERNSPGDHSVTAKIAVVDSHHVQEAWAKALDRRTSDPEGAITAARTLLESACKHVLEERDVPYDDGLDLPKLYK